jgi:hypothetical protein
VLEWWDRPGPTLGQVRAKYLPRMTGASDVTSYVTYYGEVPIGYIQLYRARAGAWGLHSIGAGWDSIPSSARLTICIADSARASLINS